MRLSTNDLHSCIRNKDNSIQHKTAERKEANIQKGIDARCGRNQNAYQSRLKQNEKANINLVVVGHVDASKSTLMDMCSSN